MKSNLRFLSTMVITLTLVWLPGCEKVKDYVLENPTADYKPCNISTLHFADFFTGDALFYYNKYGNPDSVTFTSGGGEPYYIFRYDAHQNLTDYIRPYRNNTFRTWSHYIYDADHKMIIAVNRYTLGSMTAAAEPTTYFSFSNTPVVYDAQGRTGGPYDAAGNKIRQGVTYDDKVNIHRTNKIWMFVDNDYSRNNPLMALSYNKFGFPKKFPIFYKIHYSFLERDLVEASVNYMCD